MRRVASITTVLQLQPGGGGRAVLVRSDKFRASPTASPDALSRSDSQQIAQLFDQHGPRVYRRALRLLGNPADAEEATQEIFIRASAPPAASASRAS